MACDGVWDVLGDEDLQLRRLPLSASVPSYPPRPYSEHRSVDSAAHALIRRSFEIGSDDNLTALVVAWHAVEDTSTAK
eukprot:4177659-Amphidinium_carterae.1